MRKHLKPHEVKTTQQMGWVRLENGDLLDEAQHQFDVLISTDSNIKYQRRNYRDDLADSEDHPRTPKVDCPTPGAFRKRSAGEREPVMPSLPVSQSPCLSVALSPCLPVSLSFFHLSLKSAGSSFAPERLLATRAITKRRSERRLR
jgi:hypothetical protein